MRFFLLLFCASVMPAQYLVNISGVTSSGRGFNGTATVNCPATVTPDGTAHNPVQATLPVQAGAASLSIYPTDWSTPVVKTPCIVVYSAAGQINSTTYLLITAAMAGTSVTWGAVESSSSPSGTVTSVTGNNGLAGAVTSSGNIGLAAIDNNKALCNNSGVIAVPTATNCTVTGTGSLVFGTNPTLTLGSATGLPPAGLVNSSQYNSGSISASVGVTNIAAAAGFPAGQYTLNCDVVITAVGSTPTLAVTIGWTDISGAARTKTCTTGVVTVSDNPATQTITSNGSAAITVTQALAVSTATWRTMASITQLQ